MNRLNQYDCAAGMINSWKQSRRLISAVMVWMLIATPALAVELRDVQFSSLPGNQIQIQLNLTGPIAQPQAFATDSPARIALDLPGVNSQLASKSVPIGLGPVHSLVAVEASNRTRVVLNLTDPMPYEVSTAGNQITIKVAGQARANLASASSPVANAAAAQSEAPAWTQLPRAQRVAANPGPAVRDINFRRGDTGEGRVVIRLPSADTRVAVREQASRVYVDLYQTSLPQRLYRRLDVVDFATPVTMVESRSSGANVEIEVQTQGEFDYMAYQTDELFTLDFRSLTAAEKEEIARQKVVYDGERLSLNFQDIEVRAVLQVLADFTDMNLVASDTVGGNITLRLKNVPWDQALDIILKTKGLAMRQNGNVMMVAPAQELAAQEQVEMESMKKIAELAPLVTEFVKINYAKAVDVASFLQGGGSKTASVSSGRSVDGESVTGAEDKTNSMNFSQENMLSPRGKVTADERTNTLVVIDTREQINKIMPIIAKIDIPTQQVLIESRVVTANSNFARDLGVRFGVSGSIGSVGGNEMLISGGENGYLTGTANYDTGPFGLNTGGVSYNSAISSSGSDMANIITNLPVAGASGSVNFLIGKVGSYLLQLELSAMQREGRGEIVSSPRVITSDQKQATIKMGQQIPYKTVSEDGTTTSFKEAMLQLNVTPHITPDQRVIMDLVVSKDAANYSQLTPDGYPIDTNSVETSVLVDNGETVVLGGVYERTRSYNKEQVPWLGDIPVLGRLFKNEARSDSNSELLIFVTPKILSRDMAQN
ncbi:type IV pilus assembly protein PilQ [Allochromatium warmingii]|uniref:Type IV pilus assembly protein PilQ n=1 Tax=Allochromatium warmingii TaxID=61595 RepID=A0A1H3DJZ5_ALLWA|nr:type IV pilus secretin PilQ [Allochromatium warmingii]SDX66735.1 type IV pilus assembly protein PilQ [Allochromatium warmingii]